MANTDATFDRVKEALEIASRIEAAKEYIREMKLDMTYDDDAVHRIRVDDVDNYIALDKLGLILYELSRDPNKSWDQHTTEETVLKIKNRIL